MKALVAYSGDKQVVAHETSQQQRTSRLAAPILKLTGHAGEVYGCKFSPNGDYLASCSHDHDVFLWEIFTEECKNTLVLKDHTAPVLDVQWTDGSHIVSGSADKTVALFDAVTGERDRKFSGHKAIVNAVAASRKCAAVVASASNDRTARVWDARAGSREHPIISRHPYPVTAVEFSADGNFLFTGSIDDQIRMIDLRMEESSSPSDGQGEGEGEGEDGSGPSVKMTLSGHTDTVTGLSLSNDGNFLLSNAMDDMLRLWDVRPYARGNRCLKIFQGHKHTFEKTLLRCAWSRDNQLIAAGSADGFVNVWSTTSRAIIYKLPGHTGSVNDVQFHPAEPIIASCGADKVIFLGEIAKP